ncbi:MAG TPA: Mur ligase family protein [Saprospiraceae bacterium]|nr:Mur ligase family protein [Saprospiraceae bacterium]HND87263.1 Mur ligase family protein [Saprospiraceae bacterium]HNG88757.1 Mur ligase family protein [Saprospiraceae bacterium]
MTYAATLEYLYAHLPMYHRVGVAAYKEDLANTLALCDHLGHPERRFRSIHVGGTNGKGSVSHMLAALCQASGLKTGLYISPHYKDFRERIKVNGRYIPRSRVVDFVQRHRARLEEIQPSFFEMTVGMAFEYFADEQVDIAIIEVGLGGRLDSTNVITPLLSVITNISYDHMNLLGDTLPRIATEKAGIIKPGIPALIGETHPDTAPVFEKKAAEAKSPLTFADAHWEIREKNADWDSSVYDVYRDGHLYLSHLAVAAAGPYQTKNVATALAAWEQVKNRLPAGESAIQSPHAIAVAHPQRHTAAHGEPRPAPSSSEPAEGWLHEEAVIRTAFAQLRSLTRLMGRWQVIGHQPTVLCDSAHNEAGIRLAFERIQAQQMSQPHPPSLHIVTGFVNDKEVGKALALFPPSARYYFAKADIPRGLQAELLRQQAAGYGLHGRAYSSVKNALRAARRAAKPQDWIIVIGSIFVVAEVLPPPAPQHSG